MKYNIEQGKNIVFDWFVLFSFDDKLKLGKPRKLMRRCIRRLILWGWRIYIIQPRIPCLSPTELRCKLRRADVHFFEVLYSIGSLDRLMLKRGIYIDAAYFYMLAGNWLFLWFKFLRKLREVCV